MVKKGIIETVLSERKFTKDNENFVAIMLRVYCPFVRTDAQVDGDYILAEKIVSDTNEERGKIQSVLGKERTLTMYFKIRSWVNPQTNEVRYFQDVRLTKIAEEL